MPHRIGIRCICSTNGPIEYLCTTVGTFLCTCSASSNRGIHYKLQKMAKDPLLCEIWTTAMGKEFINMVQGDKRTGTTRTNLIFVMTHNEMRNIPKDRDNTYSRLEVNYRPQQDDPNRVCMTAGMNLIAYRGEFTTPTADITRAFLCVE